MEYSAQILEFNKTTTKKLEQVQMRFFRGAFGVESTTPHAVLRMISGVDPVESRAAKLKLKHFEKIKDTENSILGPIVRQRNPVSRGYTLEIEELHKKWDLDREGDIADKIRTIEKKAWERDLEKIRALSGEHNCFLFTQHYNNETPGGKYTANNVLNSLDRAPREERGAFVRFLVGFAPFLRRASCVKCGFVYNFSNPATAPAVHLLAKCPFFAQARKTLTDKTAEILQTHHRLLGTQFKASLNGDC